MIDELKPEDMKGLVEFIQEKEPDLVALYLRRTPPVKVRLATEWLHALICEHGHPPCEFYEEDQLADTWAQPHHQVWLNTLYDICDEAGITFGEFYSSIDCMRYLQSEASRRQAGFNPVLGRFLEMIFRLKHDALIPAAKKVEGLEQLRGVSGGPLGIAEGSAKLSETDQ